MMACLSESSEDRWSSNKISALALLRDTWQHGLFYAWDGIIRHTDKTTRINLLLNRASTWLQVDSYLPYEGKVVLTIRSFTNVLVRMPVWVNKGDVKCQRNGETVITESDGQYTRLENLHPGDKVIFKFPMKDWTADYMIPLLGGKNDEWSASSSTPLSEAPLRQVHHCRFLGNTLIEIDPPLMPGSPILQRTYLLSGRAPIKSTGYFVSPTTLKW